MSYFNSQSFFFTFALNTPSGPCPITCTVDCKTGLHSETTRTVSFTLRDQDGDEQQFPFVYEIDFDGERVVLREGLYGPSKIRAWAIGEYGTEGLEFMRNLHSEVSFWAREMKTELVESYAD